MDKGSIISNIKRYTHEIDDFKSSNQKVWLIWLLLSYCEAREEMESGFPVAHQVTGELPSLQHILASFIPWNPFSIIRWITIRTNKKHCYFIAGGKKFLNHQWPKKFTSMPKLNLYIALLTAVLTIKYVPQIRVSLSSLVSTINSGKEEFKRLKLDKVGPHFKS